MYVINDEKTEIKGTMSIDSVSPFAKTLTLTFWQPLQNDQLIEGSISYPYNPNKAMAAELKRPLNKTFKVGKTRHSNWRVSLLTRKIKISGDFPVR